MIKLDKVRADTTVLSANVAYPTDSGLLARGVAKMAAGVETLKGLGLAARTATRDRTRSVRRRAHDIGGVAAAAQRRRQRRGAGPSPARWPTSPRRPSPRPARWSSTPVGRWPARGGQAPGKAKALILELERTAELVERIVAQTRVRLSGEIPDGSTRVVSLHDPDARPIAKGRLGKPVEFGYKA